jgi:hypothetical protein
LDAFNAKKKKKKRWKKPGEEDTVDIASQKEAEKRRFDFPVIRGLQFCPETRMYVDRDVKASLTIGRLAVMRIVGNERPRAFVKEKKNSKTGVVEVALRFANEEKYQSTFNDSIRL